MKLQVEGLTKRFGGVLALDDVSFEIEPGGMVGLIGPNGSGKTTLLDVICRFIKEDGGRVRYDGKDIAGLKPHEIARRGIGRTFQISRVFEKMTVLENILSVPVKGANPEDKMRRVERVLEMTRLEPVAYEYGKNLSGGQKKLLEIARILTSDPDFLMMDEPFAGVDPAVLDGLLDLVNSLNSAGKTFLIVEHNISLIMRLCRRLIVLDEGRKIAEGPPEQIRNDAQVIEAYLGA